VFADALVCGSYRLKVWQDLFGCVLLTRPWGPIGTEGRVSLDPHHDAIAARNALAGQTPPLLSGQPGMHAETLPTLGMFRAAAVPAAGASCEP
jgi:hypothetical protein